MSSLSSVGTQVNFISSISLVSIDFQGKKAVAANAEVQIDNDMAILSFEEAALVDANVAISTLKKIDRKVLSVTDVSIKNAARCAYWNPSNTDCLNQTPKTQVKRVFVNLKIPITLPEDGKLDNASAKWVDLVTVAGTFCQTEFENMKPKESVFIVRFGGREYRANKHFFPRKPGEFFFDSYA